MQQCSTLHAEQLTRQIRWLSQPEHDCVDCIAYLLQPDEPND